MKEFIGREREINLLENAYNNGNDLVLLTGRRRIGKTRLIREFIKDKDSIYFLATNVNEADMLNEFGECIRRSLGTSFGNPRDWREAFSAITEDGKTRILVLDEFSYMMDMNEGFIINFQGIFDEILKDSNVLTILCGSHRSVMERLSDDYKSPLYGRFDRRIVLKQLDLDDIPSTGDLKKDIERYAVHGGIPRYMEVLGDRELRQSVKDNVMDPSSLMFEDPLIILSSDVGGSSMYLSIVKAIGRDNHRLSEIASSLEVQSGMLTQYLNRLIEVGMVRKETPVTENEPENSKKGQYYLDDHFTQFWFRFVYPFRPQLMFGDDRQALTAFDRDFIQRHVGFVFEDVCRNLVRRKMDVGFIPERVGRYWDKNNEIDILALNKDEKRAFVGECKYGRVNSHDLNELRCKASKVKDLQGYMITFGLFTADGFSEDLHGDDVMLFGPDELLANGL